MLSEFNEDAEVYWYEDRLLLVHVVDDGRFAVLSIGVEFQLGASENTEILVQKNSADASL